MIQFSRCKMSLAGLLMAGCMVAGCGTLFLPSSADITVNSNPVKAAVTIDGVTMGVTPLEVSLPTNRSYVISVSKEGYGTVSCTVNRKVSGVIVVLYVLGGLVPALVDATTGGWYKLDSDSCTAQLPLQ